MKKENIKMLVIGFFAIVVPIIALIGSIIMGPQTHKENEKTKENVMSLVKKNIIDYENYKFEKEKIQYSKRPKEIKNILLLEQKNNKWEVHSAKGITTRQIKSQEDLDKVDIIVFAFSSSYSRKYQYTGSKSTVNVENEKVELYFYNPKEKCLILHKTLPYHQLPKTIRSSQKFTYSVYEIKNKINQALSTKKKSG